MEDLSIGIIGTGNMGSAVLKGLFSAGSSPSAENVYLFDKDGAKVDALVTEYNVRKAPIDELLDKTDYVVLAVKPQDSYPVLEAMKGKLEGKTLITIMAGINIESITAVVGEEVAVVRAMPNLAAIEGESMTAVVGNVYVKDMRAVKGILSSIGEVAEIDESLFDAVTAVSGSGPAYVFYLAEAMITAAKEFGIDEDKSIELVKQTLSGAAILLDKAPDPEKLIERVASKGGTTEAALSVFDDENMRDIIITAMKKAKTRSEELSNK